MKKRTSKLIFTGVFLFLVVWTFLSIPTGPPQKLSELSGVIFAAPPEFYVEPAGGEEMSLRDAAGALKELMAKYPGREKLGLKYVHLGGDNFLLADRGNDTVLRLAANANGTIVQTTWTGSIAERLRWCQENGSLTPKGASEPLSRNLYH